jgi:hypothetical protein
MLHFQWHKAHMLHFSVAQKEFSHCWTFLSSTCWTKLYDLYALFHGFFPKLVCESSANSATPCYLLCACFESSYDLVTCMHYCLDFFHTYMWIWCRPCYYMLPIHHLLPYHVRCFYIQQKFTLQCIWTWNITKQLH